jgi:hypothetical protein
MRINRSMRGHLLASLACLASMLSPFYPVQAQTNAALGVERTEKLPGDLLRITFTNTDPSILNFSLSRKTNLVSGSTNFLDWQTPIKELGAGRYEITLPTPLVTPVFYRIASFSGADSDGDGLADALENLIGTNPNRFDADGDGFGDGVEVANGTSPFNGNSVPALTIANFDLTTSAAQEGDGTIALRVNFARPQPRPAAPTPIPLQGTLHYRIADMSTAVAGQDFAPVTGSMFVTGSSAVIPISLVDNTNIQSSRMLVVDLLADPSGGYQVGGASRHLVLLHDNDAYWSGVLRTVETSAQLGFRLCLVRQGAGVSAALVSEWSTNASQGVGSIPLGRWPVQITNLTSTQFDAASAPIPVGSSSLFSRVAMERLLIFHATAGAIDYLTSTNNLGQISTNLVIPHVVRSNMIVGRFTDTIRSRQAGTAYAAGSAAGMFVLIQDLPTTPEPNPHGSGGGVGSPLARAKRGGR